MEHGVPGRSMYTTLGKDIGYFCIHKYFGIVRVWGVVGDEAATAGEGLDYKWPPMLGKGV